MQNNPPATNPPDLTDPTSPAVTPGVARLPVLKALTSVRFFAALHVALYHLVRPFTRWGIFAGAIGIGYTGVSFFFFLSGFILTYAHATEYEKGRSNFPKFWMARFARVYPVYFVSMFMAAYVNFADFHQKIHIFAFLADLLLLQAWSMRMVNFFNSGAWTLSCEAFFYLSFPFVLMALRPRTLARAIAWIVGFFLLAIAAPVFCMIHFPAASFTETFSDVPGTDFVFLVSRLPIFAIPEFLAGISVGWLFLRFRPSTRMGSILATVGAILMATALMLGDHLPFIALHNGLLIPVYTLLLIGLSTPNWMSRLLSGPTLVLLGEASFALYLIHIIINSYSRRFGYQPDLPSAALSLAVIIPIAILMHIYIERPCRRRILAWWASRHPSELRVAR